MVHYLIGISTTAKEHKGGVDGHSEREVYLWLQATLKGMSVLIEFGSNVVTCYFGSILSVKIHAPHSAAPFEGHACTWRIAVHYRETELVTHCSHIVLAAVNIVRTTYEQRPVTLLVKRLFGVCTHRNIIVAVDIVLGVTHLAGKRVGLDYVYDIVTVEATACIKAVAVATLVVEPTAVEIEMVVPLYLEPRVVHPFNHLVACIGDGQQLKH